MDSITYTVVYTGSEIVPVKTHIWDNGNLAAPLLIIAAVLLCAGIAAAALILLRRRKNVYVYVPDSKPREYRLIAKFRVEPDSEVPTIDAGALTLNPGDTVAVEVKKSLARHLAGREFTVSFPQSNHMLRESSLNAAAIVFLSMGRRCKWKRMVLLDTTM